MKFFISCLLLFSQLATASSEECYDYTNSTSIPLYPLSYSGSYNYNPSKNAYIIRQEENNNFSLFDIGTNKKTTFDKADDDYVLWTSDEEIVVVHAPATEEDLPTTNPIDPADYLKRLSKKKYTRINVKTGVREEIEGKFFDPKTNEFLAPIDIKVEDGIHTLNVKDSKGKVSSRNLYVRPNTVTIANEDRDFDVTINEEGKAKVYQGATLLYETSLKEEMSRKTNGYDQDAFIASTYNKNFIIASNSNFLSDKDEKKLLIYDKAQKKHIMATIPSSYKMKISKKEQSSKNGNIVLLQSEIADKPLFSLDLTTGLTKKITTEKIIDPTFDEHDNICAFSNTGGIFSYNCFSIEGKKLSSSFISKTKVIQDILALGKENFILNYENSSEIITTKRSCIKKIEFKECNCAPSSLSLSSFKSVTNLQLKMACQSEFTPSLWKELTSYKNTDLNEKTAIQWLKKFSKPKGFSLVDDLSILETLISEKIYKQSAGDFKAALAGVFDYSPGLYEAMLDKHPELSQLTAPENNDCLTEREKDQRNQKRIKFIQENLAKNNNGNFENFIPTLKLAKSILTDEEKDIIADKLGDLVVEKAAEDPDLKGIFPSKIYKFSYNLNKELLGIANKKITDVTINRVNNDVRLIQLAVSPFKGAGKNMTTGFYTKLVGDKKATTYTEETPVQNLEWEYEGKNYTAKVDIKKKANQKDIMPANTAPNYKEMKQNSPLRGLIVAGQNLGKETTDMVVRNYIEYYSNEGFDFEEAFPVKDVLKFLESRFSGKDAAHYFAKEAHSDGDEKNIMRISKEGKILRGTKTKDNGEKEIIEIVYPGEDRASALLSNKTFGEWMKKRDQEKGAELIYLNSSCWSSSKAPYEITEANTPKFINIPTTTSIEIFENTDANVMHAAIDGIRKEKTYAQIRETMKKNDDYKNRKNNVMIFPDEPDYTVLRKAMATPLSINTVISVETDKGPVHYSIEDEH